MKFFAIAVFVLAIGRITALPTEIDGADLATKVKKVIDNILDLLPEKIALTNIGITIPENILLAGTVSIAEVSVSGLKAPSIETVTFDDGTSTLSYELNFDNVHAVADITVDLNGLVEIHDHFTAELDLSNVDGKGYAVISDDPEEVTDFSLLISTTKIEAELKGLFSDDELSQQLTDEINENGAQMVDDYLADISPAVSNLIKDIINIIIKIADV